MEKIRLDYWKDGKKRALTMSYDDGVFQDRYLVEIFNKFGIRGSFHLNSGLMDGEKKPLREEISSLYAGHEVSAHGLTHPYLDRTPTAEIVHEILEDRRLLEEACGYPVRGMSYPYGNYTDEVLQMLPMLGIRYSRTTKSTLSLGIPKDFLQWHPTCHHNNEKLFELLEKFKSCNHPLPLLYVWGHSYEFDKDGNWDRIEKFCADASGMEDTWYATNIEIYDYLTALRGLEFSADRSAVYNPAAADVWIRVGQECVRAPAGCVTRLGK